MRPRRTAPSTAASRKPDAALLFVLANSAWENGRKKQALSLFKEAARLGDASAQHNLGYFYDAGVGTKKNTRQALLWYRRAWRNGASTATCMNIAQLHAARGTARSAVTWWHKAIRRGDGDAALELAQFYLNRDSVRHAKRAHGLLQRVLGSRHVSRSAVAEATRLLKAG
jgi:TPR repeat protein